MNHWGDTFGINTYSYTQSMSAVDCVRTLVGRGVKSIELMLYPGHLWITDSSKSIRDLRREIDESGTTLVSLNSPNVDINIASASPEMRAYSINLNAEYLRLSAELNARGLIVGPGKPNPLFPMSFEKMEAYFFAALDTLLPMADSYGVGIWIENMPFAFLPDAANLIASLDRYGTDSIGVCYDLANAHFISEDLVAGFDRVCSRLRLVHISDTNQSVYRHDPVGLGDVDFARVLPKLKTLGITTPPMLEIISRDPDVDIGRSIKMLSAL
ncbi:MAG: TIM barrel protein [Burkholderiales bacterium]|nr:TIM barrel protein [Burkholderiales bacterium]